MGCHLSHQKREQPQTEYSVWGCCRFGLLLAFVWVTAHKAFVSRWVDGFVVEAMACSAIFAFPALTVLPCDFAAELLVEFCLDCSFQ